MGSNYVDVYNKRQSYDCTVQPFFKVDFTEISKDLKTTLSLDNPYSVRPTIEFTKNNCYKVGNPSWFNGTPVALNNFMYRIDNLYKIFSWNELNIVNKSSLRKKYSINRFDVNLIDLSEIPVLYEKISFEKNEWNKLSELLIKFETPRGITWWTDQDLNHIDTEDSLLDTAQQLGIATNWINKYSILIRCDYNKLVDLGVQDKIKVPSIVDAFNSPIFLAQKESIAPVYGIAINLKDVKSNGFYEYIIREIPLDLLEFKLIRVSDLCKKKFASCEESSLLYDKVLEIYP